MTDRECIRKLVDLVERAIEIIESRGPSGQEMYDIPQKQWLEEANKLLGLGP